MVNVFCLPSCFNQDQTTVGSKLFRPHTSLSPIWTCSCQRSELTSGPQRTLHSLGLRVCPLKRRPAIAEAVFKTPLLRQLLWHLTGWLLWWLLPGSDGKTAVSTVDGEAIGNSVCFLHLHHRKPSLSNSSTRLHGIQLPWYS